MKIGIVIHTNSGHTLKFAQAIRDRLTALGHEVDLTGLLTKGVVNSGIIPINRASFTIKNPPDLSEFDAVLVGGPVWAFKPSPVIMKYLVEDVRTLKGKKAMAFVTMGGGGGDRAIRKMNEELEASAADVLEGEKLKYFFKFKAGALEAAVERICEKLGAGGAKAAAPTPTE